MTVAAVALFATSSQAATVAQSVTANPDGTTTYSKTTDSDVTMITPASSDDMYVSTDDPVYPMTGTTTTTTYSREISHPSDETNDYYVSNAPGKTYAVGVDENGDTAQHNENMTVDNYNN